MKHPHTLRIFAPLFMIAVLVSFAGSSVADDKVISAEDIAAKVVDVELTRSFVVPFRKGLQYESSRSITVEDRSLVEVEIPVDPEANISIPIKFALDESDQLANSTAIRQLDEIVKALVAAPASDHYLIEGHTCVRGSVDHNNRLSIARANYIVTQLEKSGVKAKLTPIGCGPSEAEAQHLDKDDGEARLAPFRKVILHKVAE